MWQQKVKSSSLSADHHHTPDILQVMWLKNKSYAKSAGEFSFKQQPKKHNTETQQNHDKNNNNHGEQHKQEVSKNDC